MYVWKWLRALTGPCGPVRARPARRPARRRPSPPRFRTWPDCPRFPPRARGRRRLGGPVYGRQPQGLPDRGGAPYKRLNPSPRSTAHRSLHWKRVKSSRCWSSSVWPRNADQSKRIVFQNCHAERMRCAARNWRQRVRRAMRRSAAARKPRARHTLARMSCCRQASQARRQRARAPRGAWAPGGPLTKNATSYMLARARGECSIQYVLSQVYIYIYI